MESVKKQIWEGIVADMEIPCDQMITKPLILVCYLQNGKPIKDLPSSGLVSEMLRKAADKLVESVLRDYPTAHSAVVTIEKLPGSTCRCEINEVAATKDEAFESIDREQDMEMKLLRIANVFGMHSEVCIGAMMKYFLRLPAKEIHKLLGR